MLQLRAMGAAAQCGLGLPCTCLLQAFSKCKVAPSEPAATRGQGSSRVDTCCCVICISDHEMALLRAMRCGLQLPCLRDVWAT